MISQRKLPPVVNDTVLSSGQCEYGGFHAVYRSVLAGVPFKSLWNKLTVYYGVIPPVFYPRFWCGRDAACFIWILRCWGCPWFWREMPAASTTAILADRYDCDAVFSAKCVVSTTLLSIDYSAAVVLVFGLSGVRDGSSRQLLVRKRRFIK